jgi:anti-sigma B factor antagonist
VSWGCPSAFRYLVRAIRCPGASCVLEEVARVPDGSCSFLIAGDVPVVTAPAEIDITTAGQLRATLAGWAARGHVTVVVDLAGTQFCDCAGLGVLVRAHQQALAAGGGLRVVLPASGPVPRIFILTGLDRMIPHFTILEQALAQVPDGRVRPRGPRPSPGMRSRTEHDASTAGSASAEVDRVQPS